LALRFSGKFYTARSAILPAPFCGTTAVCTLRRESLADSRELSAMYVLMARLAQSDAVRHIVAEDGVLLPRLDVMRLYSASASTLLAGVIVSFVDGITPLLVLVRITLFVCILLALGCVAAILAAIFRLQMAVGWMERIAAPMARNKRLWSIEGVALFCAFARAKSTVAPYVAEWLAAHGANGRKAFIAFPGVLIVGNECLSALSASALRRLEQWRYASLRNSASAGSLGDGDRQDAGAYPKRRYITIWDNLG